MKDVLQYSNTLSRHNFTRHEMNGGAVLRDKNDTTLRRLTGLITKSWRRRVALFNETDGVQSRMCIYTCQPV